MPIEAALYRRCGRAALAALLLAGPGLASPPPADLSPARWSAEELAANREADFRWQQPPVGAAGSHGVIAATTFGGTATRVGLDALAQGGSAVDAALAAALVQTVWNLGSWTSFAGTLSMVVYDAASGEVHTLDGGWNTVLGETDPQSIPPPGSTETPGRKVLVPGFMAAAQAAHDRFGRLPWGELFAPAIHFAEHGFELHAGQRWLVENRREAVTRLPDGRAIFLRPDGELYEPGERFRQPQLAATLRAVARDGADHMYRGEWAEALVAAVRRHGGKLMANDLKSYRPVWRPPARGRFGEFEVAGQGLPIPGGADVVQAFQLLEQAGLDPARHYTESAPELERVIRATHAALLFLRPDPVFLGELFGEREWTPWARTSRALNRAVWQRMSEPDWLETLGTAVARRAARAADAAHSDGIVVADAEGNVVALLHTINTVSWGSTGLFVGGVSISDAAAIQQGAVAAAGPGHRLLDTGHPFLVLRDGRPVVASASVGRGLHITAVQHALNLLVYRMSPLESARAPQFLGPFFQRFDHQSRPLTRERVYAGTISDEVLAGLGALGRDVAVVEPGNQQFIGYWAGLRIDPESGWADAVAAPDGWAAALPPPEGGAPGD